MEPTGVQQLFFQHIKGSLPGHISMVDDVAEVLGISNDSAYRRIRGEKQMSFEEIQKLCKNYHLSLDQFFNLQNDVYIFSGKIKALSTDSFTEYLDNVQQNFQYFNSFERKHLYILNKDISPFVNFQIPELASFKFYFWMKSILDDERFKKVKFDFKDSRFEQYYPVSKKIIELYNKVPMTEIWNVETMNTALRQINFYYESGMFKNKDDVALLYTKVEELISHIEKQAELGVKFNIGEEPKKNAAEYRLLVNELILGDNTYFAELGDMRLTFLNHSVLYFVATKNEHFNNAMFHNLQNLVKKSTMISTIGEKERVRFFNQLRDKIQERLTALK